MSNDIRIEPRLCVALMLGLIMAVCAVPISYAHDPPAEPTPSVRHRGRAVLAKIETMQSSVRQRLKNALMPKAATDMPPSQSEMAPRSSRYHDIHSQRDNTRTTIPPIEVDPLPQKASATSAKTVGHPLRPRQTPGQQTPGQQEPGHQWIDARNEVNPTQYSEIQYREILEPSADESATMIPSSTTPPALPEPFRPVARLPIPSGNPRMTGGSETMIPSARADMYHSSVDPYQATFPPGPSPSFQGGPNIVAQRLNQSQMTATERALGLMRENELLRNSRKILSADNDRLKADLAQKVALLSRTDEAMTEAQSALQNVELANKRLTQKLADLERKHQQYLIETDRMLTSLKDELDDVLVSEINHGGN